MTHCPLPIRAWLAAALCLGSATAQSRLTENTLRLDEGAKPGRATLEDFAWLEGRWVGQGLGGRLEENWGPSRGGSMLATFRHDREDGPHFYELCVLAEVEGSVAYHVKHFNPDMTGWEEKDVSTTFRLVKVTERAIHFDGLTLVREGDVCRQYLAMKGRDGTHREAVLTYRLVSPDEPTTRATAPVSLEALEPLVGVWEHEHSRATHRYDWVADRNAMRLRVDEPGGSKPDWLLEGTVFGDPTTGEIGFVALGAHGDAERQLFRGSLRVLADGRIEQTYTVTYPRPEVSLEGEPGRTVKRYREILAIEEDRMEVTLERWEDGAPEPAESGTFRMTRRAQ